MEIKTPFSRPDGEKQLHRKFTAWSADHAAGDPGIGTLPYLPWIFRDQRVDKPSRRISRLGLFLPETAYINTLRKIHAQAVGSSEIASEMIEAFHQPAFEDGRLQSLAEYAISCFRSAEEDEENEYAGRLLGIGSGHADRLSDIGEFTPALSFAVADIAGAKYMDRFDVVINKNMTRETVKIPVKVRDRRMAVPVPMPWLVSQGMGILWGMPKGESPEKYGITEEEGKSVDGPMMRDLVAKKKRRGQVVGYVPAASRAIKIRDEAGNLIGLEYKDAGATRPLTAACDGGIIPVTRFGDSIAVGHVLENTKPAEMSRDDHRDTTVEKVAVALADQTAELSGVPVTYKSYRALGAAAIA